MHPTVPCVDPPVPPGAAQPNRTQGFSLIPLFLIAAAVLGGLAVRSGGPAWARVTFRPLSLNTLQGCAACFVALIVSVVLHELGHLAAAIALRFEVTGVSLGPFRLSRLDRRWTFQVLWRRLLRGSVTAIPASQINWRSQMLMVVAAGPLATGLAAAAAWLFAVRTPAGYADGFFEAAVQINVILFALGLLPTPTRAPEANDARLFLVLLTFGSAARSILLYHLTTLLRVEGRRPRHYPEWMIRRLAIAEGQPAMLAAFAHVIADWAVDRGDLTTAYAWNERLGHLTADCPVTLCYTALAHSACLDLVLQHNLTSAQTKLVRVPTKLLTPKWLKFRSLAVQELSHGQVPLAFAHIRRAEFYRPAAELPYFIYEQLLLDVLRQTGFEMVRCPSGFLPNRGDFLTGTPPGEQEAPRPRTTIGETHWDSL